MAEPWQTLDRVESAAGPLELRRRGARDFLITVAGRVLMTSAGHDSERALAAWVCEGLAAERPRVWIGGLGMGYTLRAALDALPAGARVEVVELEPAVVRWCRGPLAALCGGALDDPRTALELADVMDAVRAAAAGRRPRPDAIALDLFEGPGAGARRQDDHPLYGREALASLWQALAPGGRLGIWSETPAPGIERRLARAGFAAVETRRAGRGRRHVLYRAQRLRAPGGKEERPRQAPGGDGRNAGNARALDPRRRRR